MTVTLTPELLRDLREKANHSIAPDFPWRHTLFQRAVRPEVVLALLDRIEKLENVVRLFMEDPHAYTPRAVNAANAAGFVEGR